MKMDKSLKMLQGRIIKYINSILARHFVNCKTIAHEIPKATTAANGICKPRGTPISSLPT